MAPLPSPRGWATWRWAALLGFALLAPAALPAGGGERRLPQPRRREQQRTAPLLLEQPLDLRAAPEARAPVLAHLEAGEPLQVLRRWLSPDGRAWLRVQAAGPAGRPCRGWLPG